MPVQAAQPVDYKALAQRHGAVYSIHESEASFLPPELQRIQQAIKPELVLGKPYGDAIATVAEHEPHKIEINDPERFRKGSAQTIGHELTHLLMANLSGKVISQIPPDSKTKPYDISGIEQLRAQGKKLWQLPQEQAATIVQTYVADPSQRARLGPWIQDLNNAPLSVEQPTSPSDKGIISKIRPPVPPIEGYMSLAQLKEQAAALQQKLKVTSALPAQPANALNKYSNPEDRPAKESFTFNKAWSKPGPYATTLAPQEETEFRKWAAVNPNAIRGEIGPAPNYAPLPMADYDVRAHFHAAKTGDPAATLVPNKWDGKIHGNDKFKTPYNGGFSNESMYALPNAPRWGGNKLMTHDGKLVTDETPRKAK